MFNLNAIFSFGTATNYIKQKASFETETDIELQEKE